MKQTLLLTLVLFAFILKNANSQTCLPDGLSITSQSQIDNFAIDYPGCTHIEGDLTIWQGEFTSLLGLSQLESIGGNCLLIGLGVSSFEGLHNIHTITGNVELVSSTALNCNGLDALTTIGGGIYIVGNAFTSFSGLENLTTIGNTLFIEAHPGLTTLTGFSGLSSIGSLEFFLTSFTSFEGLESLVNINGNVDVHLNDDLESFSGLENLMNIHGALSIAGNLNLQSLSGLEQVNYQNISQISISQNSNLHVCNLQNICDFINFNVGPISITNNAGSCLDQVTVTAYCGIDCPESDVFISSQAELNDFFSNYPDCSYINVNLTLDGGDINDLSPLGNINSIYGNFELLNTSVTNLNELANLNEIVGSLTISNNPDLVSLDGLESISFLVTPNIDITNNLSLSDCSIDSLCIYIVNNIAPITISGNTGSCVDPQSVSDACAVCPSGSIIFTTQSQIDNFSIDYPNCTVIPGSLEVLDEAIDITNLDGLSQLEEIKGNLSIENGTLSSLNGLHNITNIDGDCGIFFTSIPNLSGLTALESVGSLTIFLNSGLINLEGLENLTSILGNINIDSNYSLTSFEGLENFTSFLGDLHIRDNLNLENLEGLGNLVSIDGSLVVSFNHNLIDLTGIESLIHLGGDLALFENSKFENVQGLSNLNTINGGIYISFNALITSLSGLENVDFMSISTIDISWNELLSDCNIEALCEYIFDNTGPITIRDNAGACEDEESVLEVCTGCPTGFVGFSTQSQVDDFAMNYPDCTVINGDVAILSPTEIFNLHGLSQLVEITGDLLIDASNIEDLNGLHNIVSVGNSLEIINTEIIDFTGLNSLVSIGGNFDVTDNSNISSFTGLENLKGIGGSFILSAIDALADLSGLEGLESINSMFFQYNYNLVSLKGLENITSISGSLSLQDHVNLENIQALSNLASIGGSINILNNQKLTSLDGLQNVDHETIQYLEIEYNPILAICNSENICDYIESDPSSVSVNENAGGCANIDALIASCGICPGVDVFISSQLELDEFVSNYPTCDELHINLTIDGLDIFDLSGMGNITSITGDLSILNTSMTNMEGLNGLIKVAGEFSLINNNVLTSISQLDNLENINSLVINDNDNLISLTGLDNMKLVTDMKVVITNNMNLSYCEVLKLCDFISVDLDLEIESNAEGCKNEYQLLVNCISEYGCPSLNSNLVLKNQYQVDNIKYLSEHCMIEIDELTLSDQNNHITNLDSLVFVDTLEELKVITSQLENFDGLQNLEIVEGDITISGSYSLLTNFNGLSSLKEIQGDLSIEGTDNLSTLKGLETIETIGDRLYIVNNSTLSDISAIENATFENLWITNNPQLSACNIASVCTYFENPANTSAIWSNGPSCNSQQEVMELCDIPIYDVSSETIDACYSIPSIEISNNAGNTEDLVTFLDNSGDIVCMIDANGQDLGMVSIEVFVSSESRPNDQFLYINRDISITPEFQPTEVVIVLFFYTGNEFNLFNYIDDPSLLQFHKSEDSCDGEIHDPYSVLPLTNLLNYGNSTDKCIVVETSSFSIFHLALDEFLLIGGPISLGSFEVKEKDGDAHLSWTTYSEEASDYFSVEYSTDAQNYSEIGQVKAYGNSTVQQHYNYTHEHLTTGIHYYRLVSYDIDGTRSVHSIRSLEYRKDFTTFKVWPNPVNNTLNIESNDVTAYYIFNKLGQKLISGELDNGRVDVSDLKSGIYFIKCGYHNVVKFIKS